MPSPRTARRWLACKDVVSGAVGGAGDPKRDFAFDVPFDFVSLVEPAFHHQRRMTSELALPDVEELLPHRYPFLLVDRITAIVPGKRAVGVRQVTADEWFTGLASSYEMPNILILEALAQLSGAVLVGLSDQARGAVGYFVGMQRVRFRGVARAGDELVLECDLLQFKRGICKTAVTGSVDGRQIVRAQITTVLRA